MRKTFGAAILASLLLAVVASILVTSAWSAWHARGRLGPDSIATSRVALARVARLTLFLAFAGAYALLGRKTRPPFLRATGFAPANRAICSYAAGFLAGAVPVVALIVALVALGERTRDVPPSDGSLAWHLTKYVLAGVILVIAEEGLFRGLLLGDFVRASDARTGVIACSVFFAASHFLGVSKAWREVPIPDPGGIDVIVATFAGLGRMGHDWPQLVGLVLVGLILAILRLRTGTLYLGMGIHAGWFWVKQVDHRFVASVDSAPGFRSIWVGSEQYLDGVVGWVALLATLALALKLRLRGNPPDHVRESEP